MNKIFVVAFLLSWQFVLAQKTVVYKLTPQVGKDVDISSLFQKVNYEGKPKLNPNGWTVKGALSSGRTLIEFPLECIPSAELISKAVLKLYHFKAENFPQFKTHTGNTKAVIKRVIQPWNPKDVTWVTQPAHTNVNQVEFSLRQNSKDNLEVDVTNLVIDSYKNFEDSHGFLIRLKNENPHSSINFCSSDCGTPEFFPELYITYKIPDKGCFSLPAYPPCGSVSSITNLQPWANYGQSNEVSISWNEGEGGKSSGLLDFDLTWIPREIGVRKASLTIPGLSLDEDGGVVGFGLENSFSPDRVTWNSRPSRDSSKMVKWGTGNSANVITLVKESRNFKGIEIISKSEALHPIMWKEKGETIAPELNVCFEKKAEVVSRIERPYVVEYWQNPGNDNLIVRMKVGAICRVEIFDINSKKVWNQEEIYYSEEVFRVGDLPPGKYTAAVYSCDFEVIAVPFVIF